MASGANRYRERREALERIKRLRNDSSNVFVIHYSCESFYSTPAGNTARVTSLAVRNLFSAQTRSFSIHKVAEQEQIPIADVSKNYDRLEKELLDEFFDFVRINHGRTFVHWNMRDGNYGFAAIEHRYKVLGGTPIIIDEARKFDLARALVSIYGRRYISHGDGGRFLEISKFNRITRKDALNGKGEADAFENEEYLKLHMSTLRKVDMMANIFERVEERSLKTNAKFTEIYGSHPQAIIDMIKDHWLWSLVVIVAVIIGLVSYVV